MRLDLDCVRELLLCVEEETGITKNYVIMRGLAFSKPNGFDISDEFTNETVIYHIKQCVDSGLIEEGRGTMREIWIEDLTPKGHEFLANIRDNNNWNEIKKQVINVGATALNVITQIASNVISAKISNII